MWHRREEGVEALWRVLLTFIDRRPVGSVQKKLPWRDEKTKRYFPQWKRPDGRDAGMVWTTGKPEKVWLAFTGENVEFHSVSGLRVRPKRDGKKYLVPLSESPIYFTGGELRSDAPASHLQ